MKRTIFSAIFTTIASTVALAHPGHIEAAAQGHSHWLAYGIVAGVAAVATGIWFTRASARTKRA